MVSMGETMHLSSFTECYKSLLPRSLHSSAPLSSSCTITKENLQSSSQVQSKHLPTVLHGTCFDIGQSRIFLFLSFFLSFFLFILSNILFLSRSPSPSLLLPYLSHTPLALTLFLSILSLSPPPFLPFFPSVVVAVSAPLPASLAGEVGGPWAFVLS